LQNLERDSDDFVVTGVQSSLDGDNQLGNDGEHLGAAFLKHVEDALHSEEAVGVLLLTDSLEEDGQVVMVVELHDIDLPLDLVLRAVLNGDRQVTTVVEAAEFARHDGAALDSTSDGRRFNRLFLGLVEGRSFSSDALALFEGGFAHSGSGLLSSSDIGDGHELLFLTRHVIFREVAEAGVLGLWEQLVLGEFPSFAIRLRNALLEVVLRDHRRGIVDFGHGNGLNVTHFDLPTFLTGEKEMSL